MKQAHSDSDRIAWLRPLHSLRDSYGTTLADTTIPLEGIQELMRQRDMSMTRRYVQVHPKRLQEAVAAAFD